MAEVRRESRSPVAGPPNATEIKRRGDDDFAGSISQGAGSARGPGEATPRIPDAQSIDFTDPALRYRVWAGHDDRRTFLCLHGLGGTHLHWAAVADALSVHGRVVAVDLPGFGGSGPSDGITSVEAMSRGVDLARNLFCAGRLILVGHDLGAVVAMTEAGRAMQTEGLVLTSPPLPPHDGGADRVGAIFGSAGRLVELAGLTFSDPVQRASSAERLAEEVIRKGSAPTRQFPEWIIDAVRREARQTQEGHPAAAAASAGVSLLYHLGRPEWVEQTARRVVCPVLVIHGTADAQVPLEWSRELCRGRREWTLQEIEGAGHSAHIDSPELWATAVVDWLDGVAAPLV